MSHNIPGDLRYTETHEWVRPVGDAWAVGITDHAVKSLTDITFLDLADAGKAVAVGDSFGEVESVKAVAALNAPVAGTITETNRALPGRLEDLAGDPYGKGWLVKIKPSNPAAAKGLLDAAAYLAIVEKAGH
ncbi:MAG: glycine cleavage system protein GcvH [Planctomycetota bacterium]